MAFKKRPEEKILDVDAAMQGTLSFKDPVNLRINGKFEGTLDAKGVLTIGPTANVTADIVGDSIIVEGKIRGKITAKVSLELLPGCVIDGENNPTRLIVSEGAILNGKCQKLGDILNPDELARYLEVEINSILEWANQGKIPAVKQGNDWRFERKAIDSWVAAGKIGK
ncbi:MAG: polymer-forming cytoskeletal protein [Candidatus Omnitrophica bacterium]|nr:polymer-forming cytoskeletal protein [Candidatus Omnitrophota bacterium]